MFGNKSQNLYMSVAKKCNNKRNFLISSFISCKYYRTLGTKQTCYFQAEDKWDNLLYHAGRHQENASTVSRASEVDMNL